MASFLRYAAIAALVLQRADLAAADAPGPSLPNTIKSCSKWQLAKVGDTCTTVVAASGITLAQFQHYNPDVNCVANLRPTYYYCIGVGAVVTTSNPATTSGQTSSAATSSKTTSVAPSTSLGPYSTRYPITSQVISTPTKESTFPPKKTQAGLASNCIDWHFVNAKDTCEGITGRYGTNLDDFLDWNPELDDDCGGLVMGYWVCIRVQPQSSLTLTYTAPTGEVVIPEPTAYTAPTYPPLDPAFTPSPTHGTMPRSCIAYYKAKANDRCDNVLAANPYITKEQFFTWNPVLNSNCDGLWVDTYYCVYAGNVQNLPAPPVVTGKPSQTPAGVISTCTGWHKATGGDDCDLIVAIYARFSKADFISWNPSVGKDCAAIADDTYYCVSIPGTPSTRTSAAAAATPVEPPMQSGIAAKCTALWLVSSYVTPTPRRLS